MKVIKLDRFNSKNVLRGVSGFDFPIEDNPFYFETTYRIFGTFIILVCYAKIIH